MRKRFLKYPTVQRTAGLALLSTVGMTQAAEIVFDAEFQKIHEQYADQWAQEDQALDAKLAALKAKHGKAPNIIYFMWDDAAYGRVGHPMLSKVTGMETPTFDRIAAEAPHVPAPGQKVRKRLAKGRIERRAARRA